MKKKILLTVIVAAFLTFFIYKHVYHERMNIVTLGDGISTGETAYDVTGYSFNDYLRDYHEETGTVEEYIKEFSIKGETTETLKTKISNNYTLESTNTKIQQAIAEAKILTIAIGMDELNQKNLKSKQIDQYIENMDKILTVIRIYNNKDIFLISLYPTAVLNKEKVQEINRKLKELSTKHRVTYIDIENITENKEYFFSSNSYYLNYKGHRYISEQIQSFL